MDCAVGVNGFSASDGRCGVLLPAVSAFQAAPILGPFGEIARAEPLDWPVVTIFADHAPRLEDVFLGTCANERKGRRFEREIKEATAERRDIVVMPLRNGVCDDLPLARTQPELVIERCGVGITSLWIWQIDFCGTRLKDH